MRKRYIFIGVLAVVAVLVGVATGIVATSTASDMNAQKQQISSLQNKQSVQTAAKDTNKRDVTIDRTLLLFVLHLFLLLHGLMVTIKEGLTS